MADTQFTNGGSSLAPQDESIAEENQDAGGLTPVLQEASTTSAWYEDTTVAIEPLAVNLAPIASPDAATTTENQGVTLDVLANDSDPEGGPLTLASATTLAGQGSVSVVGNQLAFAPGTDFDDLAAGAQETVAVSYVVADAAGAEATGQALVTVTGINDAPRLLGTTSGGIFEDAAPVLAFGTSRSYGVSAGGGLFDLEAADLNRDGRVDLVAAGPSGVATLVNTGSPGGLTNLVTGAFSSGRADGIDLADMNGDGAADLVVANGSRTLSVALNNGSGAFGPRTAVATAATNSLDVAVADFNGDGAPDLATANAIGGFSVLMNNRMGGFTLQRSYGSPLASSLTAGDVNGDGRADLVLAEGREGTASVWLNDGSGNFGSRRAFEPGSTRDVSSVALGDVNGDGRLDLLVGDADDSYVNVLTNNGGPSVFGAPREFLLGPEVAGVALADLNGDGRQDIVAADAYQGRVIARFNTSATAVTGQLSGTDVDAGAQLAFSLQGTGAGQYGSLTLDATGRWTYVLNNASVKVQALAQGQVVTDSFAVRVIDQHGAWDEKTVSIKVTGSNDAPVAVADAFTLQEDHWLALAPQALLANDSDPDAADGKTLVSVQQAVHGTVKYENGSVLFSPEAGYAGPASFTYTMRDAAGATGSAKVDIDVVPANEAPVAAADSFTLREDDWLALAPDALLANDSDPDAGDVLSLQSVQDAWNGTVRYDAGRVLFTPSADYSGPAGFSYTVRDHDGATSTALVTIDVFADNDAPEVHVASSVQRVVTFEDLPPTNGWSLIPTGYGGFDWTSPSDLYYHTSVGTTGPGYISGAVSGLHTAFPAWGEGPGRITWLEPGTFDLAGAWLTMAWSPSTVTVSGYNDGALLHSATYEIGLTPSWIATGWTGLDELQITSPGGYWVLDDLSLGGGAVQADEDVPLALRGISVSDVDAGAADLQVTLSAGNGTLTVAADVAGGLAAGDIAGNGSHEVTLAGSLAEINATLAAAHGVVYLGDADFHGADVVTVRADDGALAGTGTLAIEVRPVNDAPVVAALAAPVSARQDEAFGVFVGDAFLDVDGDALAYSATLTDGGALPAWLQFDGATLMLSGAPTGLEDEVGVRLAATDPHGASAWQDLSIAIGRKLDGGNGVDVLTGGRGDDRITGGNAPDRLDGGAGDDRLAGNRGADVLTGGAGRDVFVLEDANGADTITDFELGVDRLELSGVDLRGLRFSDADRDGALDAQVQLSNGSVTLLGVAAIEDPALLFA